MKKELIFLGPPACGKGTQTNKLAQYFGFPHVDTGSLLRAEIASGSENGKIAKRVVKVVSQTPTEAIISEGINDGELVVIDNFKNNKNNKKDKKK